MTNFIEIAISFDEHRFDLTEDQPSDCGLKNSAVQLLFLNSRYPLAGSVLNLSVFRGGRSSWISSLSSNVFQFH